MSQDEERADAEENPPTWEGEIKGYFTQLDIGCMRARGLDLASYEDVKNNAEDIHERVASGSMPKGGRRWPASQVARFKAWMDADFPPGGAAS